MFIIFSIIVAVFFISSSNKNVGSANQIVDTQEKVVDDFVENLDGYLKGPSKEINSFNSDLKQYLYKIY